MFKKLRDKYNQYGTEHPVLKEWIETFVFVIVMVIIIRYFVCEIRWIPSGSMKPTLLEGDRIIVERVTHFYKKPQRGDILVFYPPFIKINKSFWGILARRTGILCNDIAYIKRVVGMPGDKVEIKKFPNGQSVVYINDKPLEENYVMDDYDYIPCSPTMYCGPMVVPEGKYFMMGDNRGNSEDSRFWGFLPEHRIVGRAITVFWPINRIKGLSLK